MQLRHYWAPMIRILDRYIFREIATTWLGVTMVLLLILLTNQFARVLGDVAKGKLPRDAAFDVIGLSYYPWWHGNLLDLRECLKLRSR